MRGCLLSLILLALIAGNAYCIWELRNLRADVNDMRDEMAADYAEERISMLDHARKAMEALGRGELEVAQNEVERLRELVEGAGRMAREQQERLLDELDRIRRAISEGGEEAVQRLARIVGELSRPAGTDAEPLEEPGEAGRESASRVEDAGQE